MSHDRGRRAVGARVPVLVLWSVGLLPGVHGVAEAQADTLTVSRFDDPAPNGCVPGGTTPWYRLRFGNKHIYTIYPSERVAP